MPVSLRLDKWLWQARFFKSRNLASQFCVNGRLRVDGAVTSKAHYAVRPGHVLTFSLHDHIRIIEIIELGTRRGPAGEAKTLYNDLSLPKPVKRDDPAKPLSPAKRDPGSGRPTKAERRAMDRYMETLDDDLP